MTQTCRAMARLLGVVLADMTHQHASLGVAETHSMWWSQTMP